VSGAHDHDHDHDHDDPHHDHHHHHGNVGTGRLKIALAATAAIAILELAGGIVANSLALMSDAAHVTMDVVALAIAVAAAIQASRPANERQTYGFARLEILAGLGNSALLLAVTILIVVEAVHRFIQPATPGGVLMIVVAAIGLAVNIATGLMLMRGGDHSLNARAATLHIAGDALGGIAVVIGGAVIALTGAVWVDPALSILVSAIIVAGVVSVVREATVVLLESTPSHAKLPRVRARIKGCEGVVEVHDLHVWTIGTGSHALSAHVVLEDRQISEATAVLRRINEAMHDDFAIDHVTLQMECESCGVDEKIICMPTPRSREQVSASGT
jgi:cobalt-zinc-cadmium efflux system protein